MNTVFLTDSSDNSLRLFEVRDVILKLIIKKRNLNTLQYSDCQLHGHTQEIYKSREHNIKIMNIKGPRQFVKSKIMFHSFIPEL